MLLPLPHLSATHDLHSGVWDGENSDSPLPRILMKRGDCPWSWVAYALICLEIGAGQMVFWRLLAPGGQLPWLDKVAPEVQLAVLPPTHCPHGRGSGVSHIQFPPFSCIFKSRVLMLLLNWFIPKGEWEEEENASKLSESWWLTQRQGCGREKVGQNEE